jgi:hypothetical protein
MDVTKVNEILGALTERQKTDPVMGKYGSGEGDNPVRLGSFKVSSSVLRALKKEFKNDFQTPDAVLFKQQRKLIDDLERKEIAKLFMFGDSDEDWTKVQDFLAHQPKKAMQRFLMNAQKVSPKLARNMRAMPDNVPFWFYMVMVRVGGAELANEIFGKHFMSDPYYAWKGKIEKKSKGESVDVGEVNELLELVTEGLMDEAVKGRMVNRIQNNKLYVTWCTPGISGFQRWGEKEWHLMSGAKARNARGMFTVVSEYAPKSNEKFKTSHWEDAQIINGKEVADMLAENPWADAMFVSNPIGIKLEDVELDEAKKGSSKLQKLKSKYMDAKTGRFKGGKGERFDNCVAYMKAKGDVADPEALCGKIARGKGMAPGGSKFGK